MFIKTIKRAVVEGEEIYKMYDLLVKTGALKFNGRSASATFLEILTKCSKGFFSRKSLA